MNNVTQALFLHLVAKHTVGGGTAADVAHANKQDRIRFHGDQAAFIRWLLRVRSINLSGLVFTQDTNVAMSGCANRASTELNCLANSVSVNRA